MDLEEIQRFKTQSHKGHRENGRGLHGSVLSVTLCFKKISI